jgi:plastocyanin
MRKLIGFAFTVCCAVTILSWNARATTFEVHVGPEGSLSFSPQNITINVGDTVEWIWDSSTHSATSGTPGNPDGLFDSGVLNSGATFSFTFLTAGAFSYFCTPHGLCCGMVGSVTVNNGTNDIVTISRAQYDIAQSILTVQATDSNDDATLTVSVLSTGEIIGTLKNKGDGNYSGKFRGLANPQKIAVKSDSGGRDTARVKTR